MPTDRLRRARLAFAIIIGLLTFLLGSLYHEVKQKDREIAGLTAINKTVVDKLADILTHVVSTEKAAIEAGQTPAVRVEDILAEVKGIDQSLIDKALSQAYKTVTRGAPGPPGPQGPAGPPGKPAANSTSSSTTAPGGTTSTTRAPASSTTTTTTRRSTTTTTRPCALGLLGACLLKGAP